MLNDLLCEASTCCWHCHQYTQLPNNITCAVHSHMQHKLPVHPMYSCAICRCTVCTSVYVLPLCSSRCTATACLGPKRCKLHNSSRCTSGGKNQLQPAICSDAYHVETLQTASWFVSFRMSKWVSYISVSPGVAYLLNKGDGPAPKYMYIETPLDAQQIQEVTSR